MFRTFQHIGGLTSLFRSKAISKILIRTCETAPEKPTSVVKNVAFALSFTGGAFVVAALVDGARKERNGERDRWRRIQQALLNMGIDIGGSHRDSSQVFWSFMRRGQPIEAVTHFWHSLRISEQTIAALILANTAVFIGWRVPALQSFVMRHFAHTATSAPHTLLFSIFSHGSWMHYGFNMIALWSFGTFVHEALGREQFLALYTSAGVLSSLASHVLRSRSVYLSLGASGALYALLATLTYIQPESRVGLVFLPVHAPIGTVLPILLVVEGAAALLFRNRSPLDHYAHIGGAAAGWLYMMYGREYLWTDLRKVVNEKLYHKRSEA